jgi:hypothetical protein
MKRFALPASLALFAVLLWAPALRAEEAVEPVELAQAQADLAGLETYLRAGKKATNEDLISALDAVAKAYKALKGPDPLPEGADDAAKKAYDEAMKKFEADAKKFRDSAEDGMLKALKLQRVEDETNKREEVNVRAATLLGQTGNSKLSNDIITIIDKTLGKVDYQVTTILWEAAFGALGRLNDPKSLEWIRDTHIHTNNLPGQVDQLVAGFKAMTLFQDVDGTLRHSVVEEMIRAYSATELQAERNSTDKAVQAAKQFWDRIKTDAVRAVQVLAGEPQNAEGQALASMKEFQDWFRDHKNPKKEPWTKKEKEKASR